MVDEKLDVSQLTVLAAWKANSILACIRRKEASREKEEIVPPCSALMKTHLEYSA